MGSVKDRLALGVIEAAERDGAAPPRPDRGRGDQRQHRHRPRDGLRRASGYPLVVVMAENFSVERRRLMRFLGARVMLTPAAEKGTGMVAKARELAEAHGWFLCRQFENEANAEIHARTTAREILADFDGLPARLLRHRRRHRRHAERRRPGAEGRAAGRSGSSSASPTTRRSSPAASPRTTAPTARRPSSHPRFRPHVDAGLGARLHPQAHRRRARRRPRRRRRRRQRRARRCACRASSPGARASSAASPAARRSPARSRSPRRPSRAASILFMVPDTGERYLSTPLFEDIAETMTAEEEAIAASTPGFRIGGPGSRGRPDAGAGRRARQGRRLRRRRRSATATSRW